VQAAAGPAGGTGSAREHHHGHASHRGPPGDLLCIAVHLAPGVVRTTLLYSGQRATALYSYGLLEALAVLVNTIMAMPMIVDHQVICCFMPHV
jgi:hypothetical protein